MDPRREQLKNRIERLLRKTGMSNDEIKKMFEEYSTYKDGWIKIKYQKMLSESPKISRKEYDELSYEIDILIEPKY